MIKKWICYVVTVLSIAVMFVWQWFFYNKPGILGDIFIYPVLLMPSVIYIIYLLSPMKKLYAYFHAFLSSILLFVASFWSELIFLYNVSRLELPDDYAGADIYAVALVLINAMIFAVVYILLQALFKKM